GEVGPDDPGQTTTRRVAEILDPAQSRLVGDSVGLVARFVLPLDPVFQTGRLVEDDIPKRRFYERQSPLIVVGCYLGEEWGSAGRVVLNHPSGLTRNSGDPGVLGQGQGGQTLISQGGPVPGVS